MKRKGNKLIIKEQYRILIILIPDVCYCKGNGNYSEIYKKNQEKPLEYSGPLSKLIELLPKDTFFRCHRSYIVNIEHIEEINTDSLEIKLTYNNELIKLAHRRKQDFLTHFYNVNSVYS